jgi:cysteinyl-tRNA synthetase
MAPGESPDGIVTNLKTGDMTLRLYDTLTRTKRDFVPIDPNNVRMYVCGPTVYDFAHIGNARPVIVFDVLFRLLRHLYGPEHVTYVRNITDVDDKIIDRAAQAYPDLPLNEAIRKVTTQTEKQFYEDVAALGCLPPTVEPRATEHIDDMKALIEKLVVAGCAYVAEEHVLFSVAAMPDYGKLAKRSLDEMMAGARVEVAPYKKEPMDFVLWKPSKAGEPAWPSPCGIAAPGRPGWHVECSAMSWRHLGETFDIHGGGIDLMFPHHENELAQSRCAFHSPVMANYWMHNGFLQVEGEKMSKSLGNFFTIRDLLADWPGEVLRFQMLQTHYRQPIDWTLKSTHAAALELEGYRIFTEHCDHSPREIPRPILEALSDDINSPQVVAELRKLVSECRSSANPDSDAARDLFAACKFLGLDASNIRYQEILIKQRGGIDEAKVTQLIEARTTARKTKNFAESDRIRDELGAMGIVLKDSKDGTTWEVAR